MLGRRELLPLLAIVFLAGAAQASAATYSTLPSPPGGVPLEIAVDAQGDVYVSNYDGTFLTRYPGGGGPAEQKAVPAGGGVTAGLTEGADGNLYIASQTANVLLRYDTVTEAFLPNIPFPAGPTGSFKWTAGPENTVWGTSRAGVNDYIISYQLPTNVLPSGAIAVHKLPVAGGDPVGLAFGSDGNLWIAQYGTHKIARVNPAAVGDYVLNVSYHEYPLTTTGTAVYPHDVHPGTDGNLWVSGSGDRLVQFSPASTTIVRETPLGGSPGRGVVGPDGNYWFSLHAANMVVRASNDGALATYPLPTAAAGPHPQGIAFSNDAATIYVAEYSTNRLGVLTANLAPDATTGDAAAVSASAFSVKGTVNPKGLGCVFSVQYGTTANYGSVTDAQACPAGDAAGAVTALLAGLAPSTTYHYRIHATSAFGTGVGEDRTFTTPSAPVTDGDGDGIPSGVDCNDTNPAIKPGAIDIPQNGVDENCDRFDAPYFTLNAAPSIAWRNGPRTRLTQLRVTGLLGVETVRITCRGKGKTKKARKGGCPFAKRTIKVNKAGVLKLDKPFKKARLRPKAVLEVRVTAPLSIGRYLKVVFVKNKDPRRTRLCLDPNVTKPRACG